MATVLFDETFDTIGHLGLFQILMFFITWLPSFYGGQQNMCMNFLGGNQDHWCKVDRLSNYSYNCQKYVAISTDEGEDSGYSKCEQFDLEYDDISEEELRDWNRTIQSETVGDIKCENGWVYDQTDFLSTISSEYDLVCSRSNLVQLVSSIFLLGILVGAVLSGIISDRIGRWKTCIVMTVLHFVFAFAAAFAPNYWSFVIFRFGVGLFSHGSYLCTYVIMMETTGPKFRAVVGSIWHMGFSVGFMVLPGMAVNVRDFRLLQITMAVPIAVSLAYIWILPESPRWLIVQGRHEEAVKILNKIADVNNNPRLPSDVRFADEKPQARGKYSDIFRHSVLRKEMIIMYYTWFVCNLIFYGLSLNTGTLSGDLYMNTFYMALVEIPGVLGMLLVVNTLGRKPGLSGSLIVTGLFLLGCIPLLDRPDLGWLTNTFTMIGKAGAKMAFSSVYLHTAELFPTPVRHIAVGSSSMCARVSGIIAPFMGAPMMDVWKPLPNVIFGFFAVTAGLLTILLPETMNRNLPDTFEEAIALAKKKSDHDGIVTEKDVVIPEKTNAVLQNNVSETNDNLPNKSNGVMQSSFTEKDGALEVTVTDDGVTNKGFVSDNETTKM